ncbi:MAG: DNA recombination protein RmuC [Candidatus Omnitrophica bacterium CG11_big_fil_rev_8_21_14_0_20_45_26]|uniref:DNA recombination protein RmuC n=1 Tax=Candidatus Abzuiibacterium crystallinum TaxID=1974748 RepID=A0A2H0LSY5_9BACT|nr:MAG: DNA recombination protein RmuC [Candidatus Omnitrophica bacterium CG11_big_fil_rev_8_21_14_0_20_45_26]PIW64119.1 MAG: DNA recombination protein RmuC [Candidatus Omnitrophica bacterium CG12_big_fil_rev_8_21_14_0_65_45_16]
MEYLIFGIILILACLVTFLVTKGKYSKASEELRSKIQVAESQITSLKETLSKTEAEEKSLQTRLDQLGQEKVAALTRLEESQKNIAEQKQLLKEAEQKLQDTFKALSNDALRSNNQAFLDLAKQSLNTVMEEAKGEFGQKTDALKTIVKPLEDSLSRYERNVQELEKTRAEAYGNIKTQISSLVESQQALQKETGNLVSALRRPEVRGRWGELALRRVVELAGMTAYVDYQEQVNVQSDEGRLRPDMIVRLPSGREIVVDSKVATDAYLDAIACDEDNDRKKCMLRHCQQFRNHMKALSAKNYWNQFEKAPEYVVMFIPGESFLSAAVENDPKLIEDGMENSVIIATPTTLIALLRAIAYGWRQEQITQHAQEIAKLAKELYDRFHPFIDHMNTTGGHLSKAVVAFNKTIMSLERRVLVSVKKFQEFGAAGDKKLKDLEPIEQNPMIAQEEVADESKNDKEE